MLDLASEILESILSGSAMREVLRGNWKSEAAEPECCAEWETEPLC